ncbi:MAG: PBP1A family penicillin-binding protein [Alphaproteobacteria bacterium]|nr:PBP1A family penicillin-binding protein [Alphaproteobacteria bacterium]
MAGRQPSGPSRRSSGRGAGGGGPSSKGRGGKAPVRRRSSGGGGKKGGAVTTWLRTAGILLKQGARWLAIRLLALSVGVALGVAAVGGILYRQALSDVDGLLEQPVWTQSGRVLSAPMEIWPGLTLDAESLAGDLSRAGYARVATVDKPGDFSVHDGQVIVDVPAAAGPGWKVDAARVTVTFRDGRVALAGGKQRARFAPVELAGVRGPDNEARRPVGLDEIPDHVEDAVLAMEDARFREHEGLDPLGIVRALLVNAVAGRTVQGGSTLTQQTVKNLFLSSERSYERKAREAVLALALEQRRSKDQILELYLNEIYLGQAGSAGICGVDQAARAFFGKPASRLDLGEAATIAGVISAPNRYSPLRHPEAALERRDIALQRMAEVGFVTQAEADAAIAIPLQVHGTVGSRQAPWVVDAVVDEVEDAVGQGAIAGQGLEVVTTIQPALQRLAEQAVADAAAELDADHPDVAGAEIALVAVRVSDGAIVALVGGRDYGRSQFDRARAGRRQVGSTVKPLTWLFAFDTDDGIGPATVVQDEPLERVVDGKAWTPKNYDGQYKGPLSMRQALVESRNVPAVLVAERVGMGALAVHWRDAGLSTATDWPSAALGSFGATPVELASAYTAFPSGGVVAAPHLLLSAADPQGNAVVPPGKPMRRRVADEQAAFLAADVLRDVVARGTGKGAARYGVRGPVGGKTGTTDDGNDAWFAGFTDELAVAVWVGFDKGRALGLTGGRAALPAWARFVAASGTMDGTVTVPAGLERVEVCVETGAPPCGGPLDAPCQEVTEDWFREGRAPACGAEVGGGRLGLIERLRRKLGDGGGEAVPDQEAARGDAPEDDSQGDGGTEKRKGLFRRRDR